MANKRNDSSTTWAIIRRWVVRLTAVLVLVPSLINAGIDVYKSLLNVPRTQSERINSDLFKRHFSKTPVVSIPVPIKTNIGTFDMKLSILIIWIIHRVKTYAGRLTWNRLRAS